jgi:hypothetical protein
MKGWKWIRAAVATAAVTGGLMAPFAATAQAGAGPFTPGDELTLALGCPTCLVGVSLGF